MKPILRAAPKSKLIYSKQPSKPHIYDLFQHLQRKLQITQPKDWYSVSSKTLQSLKLQSTKSPQHDDPLFLFFKHFDSKYNQNLFLLLRTLQPNYQWNPFTIYENTRYPRNFWSNPKNRIQFVEEYLCPIKLSSIFSNNLNLNLDAWYSVSRSQVLHASKGSKALLELYDNSLTALLQDLYPNHHWDFATRSPHLLAQDLQASQLKKWESKATRRKYFDLLAAHFGVTNESDWSKISMRHIVQFDKHLQHSRIATLAEKNKTKQEGRTISNEDASAESQIIIGKGTSLIREHYQGSIMRALKDLYPEKQWEAVSKSTREHALERYHWKLRDNRVHFMDSILRQRFGIRTLEDWYQVSTVQIHSVKSGSSFLRFYSHSLLDALSDVYPEHPWTADKFKYLPSKLLSSSAYWSQAIEAVEKKLHIHSLQDWYHVSSAQLKQMGSYALHSMVAKNGGLANFLSQFHHHAASALQRSRDANMLLLPLLKKSRQTLVYRMLRSHLPNVTILQDYVHPFLRYSNSSESITFDVYVPELRLAVEYQGEQHFKEIKVYGLLREYQLRDFEKRRACEKEGITLVEVPYTWDSSEQSLLAMISEKRPEILVNR